MTSTTHASTEAFIFASTSGPAPGKGGESAAGYTPTI